MYNDKATLEPNQTPSQSGWAAVIKQNVDIIDYIQRFETLVQIRNGDEWQGAHIGKHTSNGGKCLNVNRAKGLWHCYSPDCKARGDVINYERDRTGASFKDACISIANATGIILPPTEKVSFEKEEVWHAQQVENATVTALLKLAAQFFHEQLDDEAHAYYNKRGITDTTIDSLLLGYAPKSQFALYNHLEKYTPDKALLLKTGLFGETDNGKLYPQFKERYMIPYFQNKQCDVCYFIGRDATGGKTYTVKQTGNVCSVAKYKKLRKTSSPAVNHALYNAYAVDREKPILILEGIIDAILAIQELTEYHVISPVTTRINNSDLGKFSNFLIKRGHNTKPIIFCFDAEDNAAGITGALDTAIKLKKHIINEQTPPNENGSKDRKTEANKDTEANIIMPTIEIAPLRKPPEVNKVDVADYIAQGKTTELRDCIDAKMTVEYCQQVEENNPYRFFDGKRLIVKQLTDELEFLENRYFIANKSNLYEYRKGVYIEATPIIMRDTNKLMKKLQDPTHTRKVIDTLKINNHAEHTRLNPKQYLNVSNGIIDLESQQFVEHTPDKLFTYQLPVAYHKDADCPKINQFISELVLDEQTVTLIFEMIGYCLLPTNDLKKAFMLEGDGDNGKSTLIDLIQRLLGDQNYETISLQDLEHERFEVARLDGKLANLYADIPQSPLRKTDIFNSIVGGDQITARPIYKEGYTFRPITTLIFACNKVPPSYTHTEAFYKRWIIIEFPNKFDGSRTKTGILREIATPEELSGLLTKALHAISSAFEKGKFSVPEASERRLTEYMQDDQPELRYLLENVTEKADSKIPRTLLYKNYCTFMEETEPNRKLLNANRFYELVRETFANVKDGHPRINGKPTRVFTGIAFIEN